MYCNYTVAIEQRRYDRITDTKRNKKKKKETNIKKLVGEC